MSFAYVSTLQANMLTVWLEQQNIMLMEILRLNSAMVAPSQELKNLPSSISTSESDSGSRLIVPATHQAPLAAYKKKLVPPQKSENKKTKISKDPTFMPKKQKKNRNVISNLIHHLLKYLNDVEAQSLIGRIIEIHHLQIRIPEFLGLLSIFNKKMKSYVTEENFKNLLLGKSSELMGQCEDKMKEFTKILRVVCNQFFRKDCVQSIIYSVKLTFESKELHYEGLRDMRKLLALLEESS